jgi:hypothetical protein
MKIFSEDNGIKDFRTLGCILQLTSAITSFAALTTAHGLKDKQYIYNEKDIAIGEVILIAALTAIDIAIIKLYSAAFRDIDPFFEAIIEEKNIIGNNCFKDNDNIPKTVNAYVTRQSPKEFRLEPIEHNYGELSLAGCCGTGWYEWKKGKRELIGIHCAGNDERINPDREVAIAVPIYTIAKILKTEGYSILLKKAGNDINKPREEERKEVIMPVTDTDTNVVIEEFEVDVYNATLGAKVKNMDIAGLFKVINSFADKMTPIIMQRESPGSGRCH